MTGYNVTSQDSKETKKSNILDQFGKPMVKVVEMDYTLIEFTAFASVAVGGAFLSNIPKDKTGLIKDA